MKQENSKLVAARYTKVKLYDDVYTFKIKDVIDVNKIDEENNVIYYKNGIQKKLYSVLNPYFLVSDEKYAYADCYKIEELKNLYKTTCEDEIKARLAKDCERLLRVSILDDTNAYVKMATVVLDSLRQAKPDESIIPELVLDVVSYGDQFLMDKNAINILIDNIESRRTPLALRELKCIKSIIDEYSPKLSGNQVLHATLKEDEEKKPIKKIELDSLVGLEDIKKTVNKLKGYLIYRNKSKDFADLEELNLNMVFTGNPGTGKTTIARIIADILYELGYVKNDNFIEATAQDLIAGYVGQTAIKTRELINNHKGSVIFIDEAYVLASEAQHFAQEALAEILKEMETRETVFIFAGYKDEMKKFIEMNSGIKSRVGSEIEFKDYTLDELIEIFDNKLNRSKLKITPKAKEIVESIIKEHMNTEKFGNGRFIDQLFNKIILNHGANTFESDNINTLKTIHIKDLEGVNEELKDNNKVKTIGFKH